MCKFFNKKNVENVEKLETIFPKAQEILEETSKQWPVKSAEEILEKINKSKDRGERYAYFPRSHVSEQTKKELLQQGYKVQISTLYDAPCFEVIW